MASITLGQGLLDLADPTTDVTVTFSEAVTGFDASDLVLPTGVHAGTLTTGDGGVTWTGALSADVGVNAETGTVSVGTADAWTDAVGNAGSAGGNAALSVDTQAPTVAISAAPLSLLAGQTSAMSFVFSEAIQSFGNGDVSVSGGTLGPITQDLTDDPTGKTFTASFTPDVGNSENGAVTVIDGSYQDLAGNTGLGSEPVAITGDTLAPTVTSIQVDTTLINHANATSGDGITVTFSEAVTGFDGNDLALPAGVHVGGLASLDGGVTWTGTLTAGANIGFGFGTVAVTTTDPWTDLAGNPGVPGFGEAPVTLTLDDALPSLANDSNAVMAFQAVVGASVLANDFDPVSFPAPGLQAPSVSGLITIGDPLTVTGISDASHGAGSVGGSLVGQYGTLTFNQDGSYRYVADNAASLAEGLQADDVFTYTAADQHGNSATATLDIKVTGHSGGAMEIVSYTAVESKTGDVISGALYDNSGKYTVGSSVITGPDNLGGTWTYTVNNIGRADVTHQDVSYSGLAYDFDYLDADTGTVYSTFYGHTGFNLGQNDKANFSGSNGLGSDGDLILIGGKAFAIASGKYVVPEGSQAIAGMKAVTFQAQESVTGDVISGVLFDNSGQYSVGSSVTVPGPDNAGGTWTYTVTSIAGADARHQDLSYQNFAYDLTYKDADLGTVTNTVFGSAGFSSGLNDRTANYSGNGGLGSDGDLVTLNGQFFAIASGKYAVPEPQTDAGTMQLDTFTAVESVTGDHINGVLFDNTGTYSVGSSVTAPGIDNMGGQWTYTVNSIAAADSAHQAASYNGMVYDLTYFDADTGTSYNTVFGTTGLTTGVADRTANYSGNQGLGSDGDLITVDGRFTAIASGKYVLPDARDERLTTAPASDGQSANLALLTNVMASSFVGDGGQGGTTPVDPSAVTPPPLLTSPHA